MTREKKINLIICKMHYLIARDFLNTLFESDINYAVIKGCPLEMYKTGIPGDRVINDIDILVSRKRINETIKIIEKHGFLASKEISRKEKILLMSSSHQVPLYYKDFDSFYAQIDLNMDIFWGEYEGERIDIEKFLENTISIKLWDCNIRTLSPLNMFIVTVLHHYKEMNSIYLLLTRPIKVRFFEDILKLIENNRDEISPQSLKNRANQLNIMPYVFYMIYYTFQVFHNKQLIPYLEAVKCKEGINLIDYYGLSSKERKQWTIDFKERLDFSKVKNSITPVLTDKDLNKIKINKKLFE